MQPWPDTRETLLERLKDPADHQAWECFVELYQPLIYRVALRRGLQDADAQDVTQRVLWSVANAAGDWQPTEQSRSFRAWLARVTSNAAINVLQRDRKHWAVGGSEAWELLHRVNESDPAISAIWIQERRLQMFRLAAERVKPKFRDDSWRCFWMTAVEGKPAQEAAQRLSTSVGAVYAARSRVMAHLRKAVERFESDER